MAAIAFLLVVLLALFSQVHGVLIPGPDKDHKYKSAVAEFPLVDKTRKDPHDPSQDRKLMVSLFMPIPVSSCTYECSRAYMGSLTTKIANNQTLGNPAAGVFEKMQYTTCCGVNQATEVSRIPVVVLEPHTDTSRLLYSNLARYMASNNMAVALIDHPHDSSVVEFPDGSVAFNSGSTKLSNFSPLTAWNSTITNALSIRLADISLVLSHLSDPALLSQHFPNHRFTSALNTSSYAIVGHGLGGTVATHLSFTDPRVRLSINLSGTAPPLSHSVSVPLFFLGRANFRREHDIHWPSVWPYLTGRVTEFDLADSETWDFTDLPIVIEASGVKGLKGFGLGGSGPWGNHAVRCFVEGILKDGLLGEKRKEGLSHCVRAFLGRVVPYMGAGEEMVVKREEVSGGVSLRRGWREMWFG
jgi:hypothetical protein